MDYKRGRGIGVFNDIFHSRCRFRDNTKCVLERSFVCIYNHIDIISS